MTTSARWALPMIEPGQAQKEAFHNEALTLIDLAINACVEAVGIDVPPAAPGIGSAWIVGGAPRDAWTGRAGALAGWTVGGWRFLMPFEGLTVWNQPAKMVVRFIDGGWRTGPQTPVSLPTAGTTVDVEARAAIAQISAVLRGAGLVPT